MSLESPRTLDVEPGADRIKIRLDRPERRNAIDSAMVAELHAVLEQLERDPKVVILSGGNGIFASGADIEELLRRNRHDALSAINLGLFERLRRTPLPSIAAITGPALGGGAELAYACDLRIGTPRTRFGQPETRLGIMAAAGGCFRLPELVGEGLAKDMLFAGRQLDAEEALAAGLLSLVVEPDELDSAADDLADRVLRSSTAALRLTKLAVNAPAAAHPALDQAGQAILFEDPEKLARMEAFLASREAADGAAR